MPSRALPSGAALALALLAGTLPRPAGAQPHLGGAGAISGTIVDAQSALPLPDAAVTLEPRAAGALPGARTVRTDPGGRYQFAGVAEGEYRLRVQRLGYRAADLEIATRGPAESRVSVGLEVAPVALQPVAARAGRPRPDADPFPRAGGDADAAGERRLEVERMRQRAHLAPDVRVVTRADVDEGVTLAEADLFRALQRLPGVSARDDYSAELHTRGAPWGHTRVSFDGIPLYDPLHTSGTFSGVNAAAVGAVLVHPGVQPVSSGGGAAASVEVRSRRGGGEGALAGAADLSLASARLALDGALPGGHAWMLAARQGYPGWLARKMEDHARDRDYWITDYAADVVGRVDVRLAEHAALEASALAQTDVVSNGPFDDGERGSRPGSQSLAARATLRAPLAGLRGEATVGGSVFRADVRAIEEVPGRTGALLSWPTLTTSHGRVRYFTAEGRIAPADPGAAPPRWSAGIGAVHHQARYHGTPALPLDLGLPPTRAEFGGDLTYGVLWGQGRWQAAPRLTVDAGVRLEAGNPVPGGGALRWSPRVAARLRAGPGATLSAAAGRSWQYVQAGPVVGERSVGQHLPLLADEGVPALRADVLTLGGEAWLGRGWLGSLTAYARRTAGVAALDPRPGEAVGRDPFVVAEMRARGVEAAARRLAGAWTASASYSWSVARGRAGGARYPAEGAQEHVLDLAARARLGRGWAAGAAFTAASGAAYTRFYGGSAACAGGICRWQEPPRVGEPGALRAPAYASLDLEADWSRDLGGWRLNAFAQLHNALGRRNPARYHRSVSYRDCGARTPCTEDVWSPGLPVLPVIGLRAAF